MAKLAKSPYRYTIKFVSDYDKKFSLSENFKFDSITEGSLFNVLKNFEVKKAAGLNQISRKCLKDGARILAKSISELCNLNVALGSFPDACKIAKVKPLFKKGSKTDPSNYRPISLLPLLSNVFEKVLIRSYMTINLVIGKTTQQIHVFLF